MARAARAAGARSARESAAERPGHTDALSEDEFKAMLAEYIALRDDPRYLASAELQPIETATTVRVRNGKLSITDGPFFETKEQLAGFYLIEARDLDHALDIAKLCPAPYGGVEVRPVMDTSGG